MNEAVIQQERLCAVKAKYKTISGYGNVDTYKEDTEVLQKTDDELFVTGGNSEYAHNIQDYEQYKLWADGIKDDPVLCDFDDTSLKPIWELAEIPKRQDELKNYFYDVLLKDHPLPDKIGIDVIGKVVYKNEDDGWARWQNVKHIEFNGAPYIFRNGRETNGNEYAHFAKIKTDDNDDLNVDAAWDKKQWHIWGPGWNLIDWYEYDDYTYHMVLKEKKGTMAINEYEFGDKKNSEIHREDWSTGWSALQTFKINNIDFCNHIKRIFAKN